MDRGYEDFNNEYREWTFTDEYEKMAKAYNMNEQKKEELKQAV